jgi:lipopolysaccharide heptosyltransferase II
MKTNPKKILIRVPNWVGDNIFTLPAVYLLRETFPEARLSVLVRRGMGSLWEIVPEIDEVITYDLKGGWRDLKRKWDLIRMLRRFRFDLAVVFPRSFESALWMRLAGIPERWGYAEEGRSLLLTRAVTSPRRYRDTPRIDYYYHLIDNAESDNPAPPAVLKLSPELIDRAGKQLRSLSKYDREQLLIGFHPRSSYGPAKCWPGRKFSRLAELLVKKHGAAILLFGSENEHGLLQEIADNAGGGVLNLAGRTDLKESAALISLCRVFVANDSGPLHLAATLEVPVIGLYGSTDPKATGPRGKKVTVIYKNVECSPCLLRECPTDFKCMEEITPEEVMGEIENLTLTTFG